MNTLEAAKQRLSEAAARCLTGDREAADEADAAMAEVKQLLNAAGDKANAFGTASELVREKETGSA